MKKSMVFFLVMTMVISFSFAQKNQKSDNKDNAKEKKVEFKWYTFEEAFALNQQNPKKIFIDIYTDWCGWCTKMDNTTWKDSTIKTYLASNFYPVKLNAERKDTVKYNGHTFVNPSPDKSRSTHQLAISLLQGQLSYPSYVILNEKFEIITMQKGYKVPKDMEVLLRYIMDGAFEKMTIEKFTETFVGTIK